MESLSLSQGNFGHQNDGILNQYEADKTFEFQSNEFYFLEFFLKTSYYLLITPFRLGRTKNGNYKIHTTIIQKAASTVVILLVAVQEILDLRVYLSKNLMKSPEKAFMYSFQILRKMYPIIWFSTFWLKRNRFEKFLNLCQKAGTAPRKPKLLWVSTLSAIIILTEAKFFWEHFTLFYQNGIIGVLKYYGGTGLYNLRVRDSDAPLPDTDMTPFTTIFCFGCWLISSFGINIEYYLEVFSLINAIMVYHSCVRFIESLHKLTSFEAKKIVENYTNFLNILKSINSIVCSILIIYVVGMVPTFIWCVFGLLDPSGEGLDYAIFYIHKVVLSLSVLILGAKANDKAEELNDWILNTKTEQFQSSFSNSMDSEVSLVGQTEDQNGFNNILDFMHRQGCKNPMGLKGGSFFTISYSFIGAATSVVLTYAVVMLQFQVEKYKTSIGLDGALEVNITNVLNSSQDRNGTLYE